VTAAALAFDVAGWEIRPEILVLGVIIGAGYGLLGVGLVLVHRSSRLINFAHGEVGVFAAVIVYLGVNRWHWPYYLALVAALAVAAATGALVESVVVGRLGSAPKLMSLVATLGIAQLLVTLAAAISLGGGGAFAFPSPPGLPEFDVGALRVTRAYTGMLVFAPVAVVGLAVLLRRTTLGLRIRSSASNPDAARLAGIDAALASRVTWALAGVLAAMTAILTAPSKGPGFAAALGPSLLLRGLAPALIARLRNLPVALAAGVVLGVVEQVVFWNQKTTEHIDVIVFVVILVATLLLPRDRSRRAGAEGWGEIDPWPPIVAGARRRRGVRHLGLIGIAVLLAFAAIVPLLVARDRSITLATMVAYVVMGVGLAVVAGLSGQLSLGHVAIGGIAATASIVTVLHTGNFLLGLAAAVVTGAAVALVVGLPALRLSGPFLAVTTLAGALAATWLLGRGWMLGEGRRPQKPILAGVELSSARAYYWFALAIGVIAVGVVGLLRAGGMRRLLVSVRDGEDVARSFGVRVAHRKLQSYVVSGAVAGLGGALYAHGLSFVTPASFPASASIDLAVMVVIGGVSLLAGPVIGVLFVVGIPAFLPLDNAGLATTKLGLLLVVVYSPSGLAQVLLPARDRLARLLGGGGAPADASAARGEDADGADVPMLRGGLPVADRAVDRQADREVGIGRTVLEVVDVRKQFGGLVAVADAGFVVRDGEIVGMIGPNGAGKTTLFEVIAGFTPPDAGRVVLDGVDISSTSAAARARLGVVRSFQSSPLFATLTVVETIATALEGGRPTSLLRGLAGPGAERRRLSEARALAERFGLARYADRRIKELSTGTRRICELACMVAMRPRVLLLDEPAAGLAQREVEALVPVLRGLQTELGCALVVIEHDLPMIMSLSDRLIAMEAGEIVADGPPDVVRSHPRVVDAYLGRSSVAVDRSGATIGTSTSSNDASDPKGPDHG
jgi:ABC-type branched-subunit amino acid transport system ATPase component/ABC-type branched-subunit amino acid transport system permease subunit